MEDIARLIVFTRFPEPGKVKTRLIPTLGPYGAARLQREMTRRCLQSAMALGPAIRLEVHGDEDEIGLRRLYGKRLTLKPQVGDDLGQRMLHAFRQAFRDGAGRVVLIGSDCPLITPEVLKQAFDRLAACPCVIGPATDGGYYLIGLARPEESLFKGIPWGRQQVLAQTLEKARMAGLTPAMLPTLSDVDRKEDLGIWRKALELAPVSIAAIIPTLNEAASIEPTLEALRPGEHVDIIVSDGGSTDATVKLARAHGARVIDAPMGRAHQLNAGAAAASADILFFLHADTRVSPGYDRAIRSALADARTAAGAFRLAFDRRSWGMSVIAKGANLRSRIFQLPYGDQGIFLWAADFKDVGGFPDLPLMDDAVFIERIKERGRIVTATPGVVTSARRYNRLGIVPAWIMNQCVLIGFHLGAPPAELARLYRSQADLRTWIKAMTKTRGLRGPMKSDDYQTTKPPSSRP